MEPAMHTDPIPMMVFQCLSCNNILGDSQEFVCSVEDLQLITLKGVSGVQVDKILQRSTLVSSMDSTYLAVMCKGCGTAVGRHYTSVPDKLSPLSRGFALSANAIQSYTLGSSEVRLAGSSPPAVLPAARADDNNPKPAAATPPASGQPAGGGDGDGTGAAEAARTNMEARIEQLEADLTKARLEYT